MSQKIDAPFTNVLEIGDGWQIVWAAVDPTTGADVSGVVISGANVVASDVSAGGSSEPPPGGYMLVPGPGA